MCGDESCILADYVCDGIPDCADGFDEDEEFCSTCPFQFLCTNGRCTDMENVCDGRNQCRDNSDEDQICEFGVYSHVTVAHTCQHLVFNIVNYDFIVVRNKLQSKTISKILKPCLR